MKNRLLRLLSFALVLCMILGTLPVSAYATGKDAAPMRSSSGGFSVGNSGRYVIAANVDGVYYAIFINFYRFSNSVCGFCYCCYINWINYLYMFQS